MRFKDGGVLCYAALRAFSRLPGGFSAFLAVFAPQPAILTRVRAKNDVFQVLQRFSAGFMRFPRFHPKRSTQVPAH
jgi:hypothetical protein